MVERQIVALDAVGSNPTILPLVQQMPVVAAGILHNRWGVAKR